MNNRDYTHHNHSHDLAPRAIRAFVWDLADEGIDEVLDHLRASGMSGLHLALAYHGGRFYCPHNPNHCIVHAPEGALYFKPLLSCYEGMTPFIHPAFGSGAFVSRVIDEVHDLDMSLTAWVVLFNNRTLSIKYPDCTIVNALGDRLDGALCPANPSVRVYAQALIEDLAHRVGVDAIEIEDFAYASHAAYSGPSWREIPLGPELGYLLSLCFCEHCRRRGEEANIEVDDLARHVERMIHAGLAGDLSERRISDEISDPYHPLARYAKTRCETVTMLLDDLIDAAAGSPTVLQPILTEEPDENWRWGIELHALRERLLRATLMTHRHTGQTRAFVERYADILQLDHDLVADVRLGSCRPGDDYSPIATVDQCIQAGVDRFVFSHYGLAHLEALEEIGGLAHR